MKRGLPFALVASFAIHAAASVGRADRVAPLPAAVAAPDLRSAIASLGHEPVAPEAVSAALEGVPGGVADTADEYQVVAHATKADWVIALVSPDGPGGARHELVAYWVKGDRTESVARELEPARRAVQLREMLQVLLRPQGVGTDALPWERVAAVPAAGVDPEPSTEIVAQPSNIAAERPPPTALILPPWFVAARLGATVPFARPEGAVGTGVALVGGVRLGRRVWKSLEIFGDFGGNIAGPQAVSLEAGARLPLRLAGGAASGRVGTEGFEIALAPVLTAGLFLSPAASAERSGTTFERPAGFAPSLGASLAVLARLGAPMEVGLQLGDLRWVPLPSGSVLLGGASAAFAYRF